MVLVWSWNGPGRASRGADVTALAFAVGAADASGLVLDPRGKPVDLSNGMMRLVNRLRLTWAVPEEVSLPYERAVTAGQDVNFLEVVGFSAGAITEMEGDPAAQVRVSQQEGSVGIGASGYGVTLVFEVLGTIADVGGLIVFGDFLRRVIDRHRNDRGTPTISDPGTLGAIAAASVEEAAMRARLVGCRFAGTVPITASPEVGTDSRDIWASCFDGDGFAIVIFMSPSGLCLGSVTVPAEWGLIDGEYRSRSAEEIAAWRQGTGGM